MNIKAHNEAMIKPQMDKNPVVTEEILNRMQHKQYHSGDDIKVGDHLLFGLLKGDTLKPSDEHKQTRIELTLISFKPEELDTIYMIEDNNYHPESILPYLVKIEKHEVQE